MKNQGPLLQFYPFMNTQHILYFLNQIVVKIYELLHMRRGSSNAKALAISWPQVSWQLAPATTWTLCFIILSGAFFAIQYYTIGQVDHRGDEACHFWYNILPFLEGQPARDTCLTTIPGYHYVMAAFMRALGATDVVAARALNLVWAGAFAVLSYLGLSARTGFKRLILGLQVLSLPLLAPLFLLVYTDVSAVVMVILMFHLAERRWSGLATLAAAGAILFRQTSLAWICLLLFMEFAPVLEISFVKAKKRLPKPTLKFHPARFMELLKTNSGLIGVVLLFAAWVFWNGSVAVGDKDQHHVSLNFGNIYLFLGLTSLFFLPSLAGTWRTWMSFARHHRLWLFPLTVLGYIIYQKTFLVTHPYNQVPIFEFFLRNRLLNWIVGNEWLNALYFIPVWTGFLFLATAPFRRANRWAFLACSFAIMAACPLIEQRYYIPTMVLFMLWRKPNSQKLESIQLVYQLAWFGFFLWGVTANVFMI